MGARRVLVVLGETVRFTFRNFCENTTLHGLRYVYGDERLRQGGMLRMIWLFVCLISIGFTTVMGMIAWVRFRTTPTITTIETMTYPIWKIPFPAVTVCNINKIDREKANAIIERLVTEFGLSRENATDLLVAQASLISFEEVNHTITELERVLGRMGWNPATLLLELIQPCEDLIKVCYWLGTEVPCPTVIRRTRTDNGYCCSFNVDETMQPLLASDNQTLPRTPNVQEYRPKRLSGAGRHVGLSLLIDVQPNSYMAPTKSFYGAEVYVHDSQDFPSDDDYEHAVQPGWDVAMAVIPLPIESSSTMSQVPQEMRNCYLPEDDDSEWAENINLNVCLSECRLRTIIKLCNCIPFYYVDMSKRRTQARAEQEINGTDYNVQTIASQRQPDSLTSANFGGRNVSMYATLNVHFKGLYCIKYKRDAYMTWDSLVATFGGIFGLCMGGSVLSMVEMLYYFTVKPFTVYQEKMKRERNERPQIPPARRLVVRPYVSPFDKRRYPMGQLARGKPIEKSTVRQSSSLTAPFKDVDSTMPQIHDLGFIF
uniref:Pickpocket n=1 Tax=Anopheles albimanus TaxID=7167 RepID=A0A182FFS8_ANOAL